MMNGHLEQIAGALDRIADQDQTPTLRTRPMTEEQRQTISGMVGHLERIAGALDRITDQDQTPTRLMTEKQRQAITERRVVRAREADQRAVRLSRSVHRRCAPMPRRSRFQHVRSGRTSAGQRSRLDHRGRPAAAGTTRTMARVVAQCVRCFPGSQLFNVNCFCRLAMIIFAGSDLAARWPSGDGPGLGGAVSSGAGGCRRTGLPGPDARIGGDPSRITERIPFRNPRQFGVGTPKRRERRTGCNSRVS